MTNKELMEEDLRYIWHPCSQMKDYERLPLIPIQSAKGVYLHDFDGNSYIDTISSWWVNLFGHQNPTIDAKLKAQVDTFSHTIFAGFTHKGIIELSRRIVELTPKGLAKCFYADNGSSAVEVALKMSFHYHRNHGKIKPYFVSLKNSYHGETIGALSVGDVELYKEVYDNILIKSIQAPAPMNQTKAEALEKIEALEQLFKEQGEQISAFIIEPLVQCAGYMNMYHPIYLTRAKALCEAYDIHFIADEVAVGFGRTGTLFAIEQADISADFICLSKGLTGGYLPLSMVVTTDEIYNAFYCDYDYYKTFLHSHSYTGNALGVACANATLDIFEKERVIETNQEKIAYIAQKYALFKELEVVKEVRQQGFILAIELDIDASKRAGLQIFEYALSQGVFIRPLGNVVYFMPPYIISYEEIDRVVEVTLGAIRSLDVTA